MRGAARRAGGKYQLAGLSVRQRDKLLDRFHPQRRRYNENIRADADLRDAGEVLDRIEGLARLHRRADDKVGQRVE